MFVCLPLGFAAVTIPFMLRKGEHAGQSLGKQLCRPACRLRQPRRRQPAPRRHARAAREGAVLDRPRSRSTWSRPWSTASWSYFDSERRGLQDRATGTRVVRAAPAEVSDQTELPLVADLHVHYPMHVLSGDRDVTLGRMVRMRRREGVGDKFRGAVLALASRLLNYRSWDAGPRVTVDFLAAGGVRVALSVLYSPFDEMDLDERYGALPEPGYFAAPARAARAGRGGGGRRTPARPSCTTPRSSIARSQRRSSGSCTASRAASTSAGRRPRSTRTSPTLAARGVAYVTLAHLFWRRVAANAPAIPFLPDALYNRIFPQAAGVGSPSSARRRCARCTASAC